MENVLSIDKQIQIISALAEGSGRAHIIQEFRNLESTED